MRVQRKKAVSPATIAPAISAATRSKVEMKTPATSNGMLEMPRSSRCTWVPQRSCAAPSMIQESPSVAMNSVIGERLTRGLSTARSMPKPSSAIAASVAASAAAKGKPCSIRLTKVSAAKSTMAPCAKFSTPEVL